jgi:hypothetical protein
VRRARLAAFGFVVAALLSAPALAATSADQKLVEKYAPILAFQA